jgi:hypothetical protein
MLRRLTLACSGSPGNSRAGSLRASPTSAAAVADSGGSENRRATTAGLPSNLQRPDQMPSRGRHTTVPAAGRPGSSGSGTSIGSRRPSPFSCHLTTSPDAPPPGVRLENHPCGTSGRSRPSACSTSLPCAGPRPKARRPVSKERSAHRRRRMARSSSLTKARRLAQGAIDAPQFLGTFRIAPLVYRDAETARIGGPLQQVEELLAAGCRAAVLLADRHRHPAQLLGPGKHAGVGLVRRVGIVRLYSIKCHRPQ